MQKILWFLAASCKCIFSSVLRLWLVMILFNIALSITEHDLHSNRQIDQLACLANRDNFDICECLLLLRENQTHKFIINHLRIWNLKYTHVCFIVRKYCVICPTMATRRHYHISREKSLGSHIWTVVSAVVVMLEKTSTSNAEYILTWRLPPRLVVPTKGKLTLMIHSGHSRSLRHKYYYVLQ